MNEDRLLLDTIISQYFDSVKDLFEYRKKNELKPLMSFILFILPMVFFVFGGLLPLPLIDENSFPFLFSFINNYLGIHLNQINFLTLWVFNFLFWGLVTLPFYIYYKYWDTKSNKKFLQDNTMDFCYLYSTRLEIVSFLANERPEHLKKSIKNIRRKLFFKAYLLSKKSLHGMTFLGGNVKLESYI